MGIRTNFICSACGKYEVVHTKGKEVCKKCEQQGRENDITHKKKPLAGKNDIIDPDFICSGCGLKGIVHRKNKGKCKACEATYLREWKKRTGKQTQYNEKISEKRRKIKELCVQYLGGKCQFEGGCCSPLRDGLEPCYMVFHFHHDDPSKKTFDISRRMRNRGTIRGIGSISDLKKADPQLIEELDKCVLLCSNCHHRLEYCDNCTRPHKIGA